MSKYEPLWKFIQTKTEPQFDLSFEEIARVLGFPIDHAFLSFKKELTSYGYQVKKIYLKDKKVTFEKV